MISRLELTFWLLFGGGLGACLFVGAVIELEIQRRRRAVEAEVLDD